MSVKLGKYGVFQLHFHPAVSPEFAAEVEGLGYGAIWLAASPSADLAIAEQLLDATKRIVVGTAIVNIWNADSATVAASYHRIAAKHPDRFLLGIGVGHPEMSREYTKPYAKIVSYLDELDALGVPAERRLLAALGPKVLELSAERTAGALPYLTTAEHTRQARKIMGIGPLLAPDHMVVVDTDEARARETAQAAIAPYLNMANYVNNLRRLGWSDDDLADGGTDRLIDALCLHGDAHTIVRDLNEHLEAGADHVAIQVLAGNDDPMTGYRRLAKVLF